MVCIEILKLSCIFNICEANDWLLWGAWVNIVLYNTSFTIDARPLNNKEFVDADIFDKDLQRNQINQYEYLKSNTYVTIVKILPLVMNLSKNLWYTLKLCYASEEIVTRYWEVYPSQTY